MCNSCPVIFPTCHAILWVKLIFSVYYDLCKCWVIAQPCSMLFTVSFLHNFYFSLKVKIIFYSVHIFKYTYYNSAPKFTLVVYISSCYVQAHQFRVWAVSPRTFCLLLSGQLPFLPSAQLPSVISLPLSHWQVSFLPSWVKSCWWIPCTSFGSFWERVNDKWIWDFVRMFSVYSHSWAVVWLSLRY